MAGLYAPLPTLRSHPRGGRRTDRGRRGLLILHRSGLSPHTPCRSPGALTLAGARVVARHPKRPFFRRWDQGFESSFLQRRGCISREQQVCTRKIPRLRANRIKQHAGEQARLVSACAGVARGGIGGKLLVNRIPQRLIDDRRVFAPPGSVSSVRQLGRELFQGEN